MSTDPDSGCPTKNSATSPDSSFLGCDDIGVQQKLDTVSLVFYQYSVVSRV